MAKSLVIVESPAKARTLTKYLGKDYLVKATVGHVIDLPEKRIGVNIEKGFEPEWVVLKGKKKVLEELKKAAEKVEKIYLASDPDREGEAIAWHVSRAINGSKPVLRVLIHEITKKGVEEAIKKPGTLNQHLINAQQARRILDRLVGYKLSPLLQKKVRKGLSAGRVQSVAVRLVCEREAEIANFKPAEYWTIDVTLSAVVPPPFTARLVEIDGAKADIPDENTANEIVQELKGGEYIVEDVAKKERKRNPAPPFTTAKLQQEAARKLKFPAAKTMAIAQALYEGVDTDQGPVGLITYMRTDSVRVSPDAQKSARDVIIDKFGKEYLPSKPPVYKSARSAQEAHEAIRPTDLSITPERVAGFLSSDHAKLYELIYLRFIASQMKPALYDQMVVKIRNGKYRLRTTATTLKFAGFTAAYTEGVDEGQSANGAEAEGSGETLVLPPMAVGEKLKEEKISPEQHFTQPPPRYTEATLVKELEEKGIGRPSTYAQILNTIQERDYVSKKDGKFYPTELGCLVNELLINNFPDILNVKFTALMEEELDKIEEGMSDWRDALGGFWKTFSERLEKARQAMRNVKKEREEVTDIICDLCGKNMVVRWGKNGEFLGCSAFPNCKNTMNFRRDGEGKIYPIPTETGLTCPKCSSQLLVKIGKKGNFLGCSSYPNCDYTSDFILDETNKIIPMPTQGDEDENIESESNPADEPQQLPSCPSCGKPMTRKEGRWGPYYACSGFPDCRQTIKIKEPKAPPKPTDIICEKCGKPMVIRSGRRGEFLACSGYPRCKNAKNFKKREDGSIEIVEENLSDEKCDKCGAPMIIKRGRYGPFLACSAYPECKNIRKLK